MSTILKIFAFPASILIICLGISTILGPYNPWGEDSRVVRS